VQVHITIPNTFTPNSDGINDKWEIGNLADYTTADVKVFNRWGSEVYHFNSSLQAWDGTRNGKPLPVGTYYYIIKT
jgi:gliding motility-associated-like protein